MKYFYLLIIVAILANIIQLPFIMKDPPKNWRSVYINKNSDIVETALDNKRDTLTQTHNLYMVLGKHAPNSILFVNEELDAESTSKFFGLGKVVDIKKRDINHYQLIKKISSLPSPNYSDVMWAMPGHIENGVRGIEWKIYLGPGTAKEFIFIKGAGNGTWFIVDKVLFNKEELQDVCDGC